MIDYERLTKKEEDEIFERIKQGDRNARDYLILKNIGFVKAIVVKLNVNNNEFDDCVSIGTIGLIKAVNSFKTNKNSKFSTYAYKCILNEILYNLRSTKKNKKNILFSYTLIIDDCSKEIKLEDVLACNENIEDSVINRLDILNLLKVLTDEERNIIYSRYGLKNNEIKTQKELGKKMNYTQSYLSRIEQKIIKKLQRNYIIIN